MKTVLIAAVAGVALVMPTTAAAKCSPITQATILFEPTRAECSEGDGVCLHLDSRVQAVVEFWLPAGGVIQVIGHAGASGEADESQTLSDQRAAFVRDRLVAMGVPSGEIVAFGRGSTEPRADEALNHRVVIDFSESANRLQRQFLDAYERDVSAALAAGAEPPPPPPCI